MVDITSIQNYLSRMPDNSAKRRAVAEQFEALFTSMMMRAMRRTVKKSSLLNSGFNAQLYGELLDAEYAKMASRNGSLGLADLIVQQIEQQNESTGKKKLNDLNSSIRHYVKSRQAYRTRPVSTSRAVIRSVGKWNRQINRAGQSHGVDPHLIAAVIAAESSGDPRAFSKAGAKGLMQLMDTTAADMAVRDPWNPNANIQGGTRYLKQMLDRFNGDERLALAAYNAGPHAVDRYKGIPPYEETQTYVDRVLAYRNRFRTHISPGVDRQ